MKSKATLFLAGIAVCAFSFAGGCRLGAYRAPGPLEDVDIAPRLEAESSSAAVRRRVDVTRKGRRVDATVLVAPATARASLAGLSGPYLLRLSAAQVFNIGDGIQMDVFVVDSSARRQIYSRYFDAGRKAEDRAWVPIEVPLALSGSGDVYLEIKVSGGPQGELVADWLAFAEVLMARARDTR